ncbi:rhomboid family intramembrane serine protease [Nocardia amikacinitolerans]|uniref:rhomboid family intramembrane serine protease n=1 Tax=Nocardia amikacinitolerans TaxID=756689 RepID=UPI0020A48B08|nr:rhomboid family intramembrane serine protease [Nocardia amikacinitolerans]MCP2276747.1 Membrane associated serine protease, rhomboid family [Nocardia amikacinitolerans]
MNPQPPAPTCARHPNRPTGLACTRCGRPACPDCLRPAAVGQHCVDCVRAAGTQVRPVRTVAGAPVATSTAPLVTYGLIALNVLFYAITAVQASSLADNYRSSLFLRWALVPRLVADGEWFRVIGSGFLHWGPLHLALNMFALYIVGIQLEPFLGRARMLAIYMVALVGGSAGGMLLEPVNTIGAGASGAVYGMFGAVAVLLIRLRMNATQILVIIAINVLLSLSLPGVSLWVHLGGLVAGTLATMGVLFLPQWVRAKSPESARAIGWVAIGAVGAVSLAVIGVAAAMVS